MSQKPAAAQINPAESVPSIPFVGRDEMNIAEFPISLLCDRAPKGQNLIEFKDKILDSQTGREIIRNLTITAPEKYGLPISTDDDGILALLQLTKQQNNFTRPGLQFTPPPPNRQNSSTRPGARSSRLQLMERRGWPDKGPSYPRIIQSRDRWSSTHLK